MENFKLVLGIVLGLFLGMVITYPGAEKMVTDVFSSDLEIAKEEIVKEVDDRFSPKIKFKGHFIDALSYEVIISLNSSGLNVEDGRYIKTIVRNVQSLSLKISSTDSDKFVKASTTYLKKALDEGEINYGTVTVTVEKIDKPFEYLDMLNSVTRNN